MKSIFLSSFQRQAYIAALANKGMSDAQATEFAKTYTVVTQSPESDPTGFSGTVFADQAGNKYFAIRGSEANLQDNRDEDTLKEAA